MPPDSGSESTAGVTAGGFNMTGKFDSKVKRALRHPG